MAPTPNVEDCYTPPANGGGCKRDADFSALYTSHHGHVASVAKLSESISAIRSGQRVTDRKLDRLIEGVQLGNVVPTRAPAVSLPEWERDEDTGVHEAPVWSQRAREAADKSAELAAKLAAAEATIRERDRISDRAVAKDDRRWSKWQSVGAGIVALLTAMGGGIGLAKLFGG